jgi:hypothetical protein
MMAMITLILAIGWGSDAKHEATGHARRHLELVPPWSSSAQAHQLSSSRLFTCTCIYSIYINKEDFKSSMLASSPAALISLHC